MTIYTRGSLKKNKIGDESEMASVRIMKGQPQKVKVFLAPSNFYLILPNYKNHLAGNVDFALFS